MIKGRASDFTLMITTMLLVFIGIIMVFSSSYPEAFYNPNIEDGYYFLKKHLVSGAIGMVAMFFFMNFDYWRLNKLSKLIFIGCILLSLAIFTPLGIEVNGARRWINLGFTNLQPAEVVKLGSIIFLSSFLAEKKDELKSFNKGLIPSLIIISISCGLILTQKDLSTSATLGLSLVILLFLSGVRILHLTLLSSLGIGAIIGAILIEPFRMRRITAFIRPFEYKDSVGWQVVQSLYALGSGGLFGLGLGKSRQKFFYIPEPYNDFIFAIIGEELGFIGCITVIILFLLLIWRGIRIAISTKDVFGCLLASGIVTLITVQSIIHIAVVTSSMPPTGIPLPFVSYGGTSLMVFLSAIGILLNISRHTDLDRS